LQLSGFDLSLTGFGDLELKDLLADRTEGLTDPDDAPAVPEHPVSQTGDLWLLGRHRLLCGDSTVATDVERVLGTVAPNRRRPGQHDNQLAITGSGWDPELLRLELGELQLSGFDLSLTGFGDLELKDLLADRTEGLTDPDDAPAVPEHPVSRPAICGCSGGIVCSAATARSRRTSSACSAPSPQIGGAPVSISFNVTAAA
jgi:hypothetical protein